jgi:uncharacterized protein YbjT (DUF2867 family)
MVTEPRSRTVCIAGSSGLVGSALLPLLLASPFYQRVHALLRPSSAAPASHPKLVVHRVDFQHLGALPHIDDVYIALGTTLKAAGSPAAFRAVDFDAVLNTARAARAAGASRLALVSALGANSASRVHYNRVKGEVQQAVLQLGFETLVIAQPSLLKGQRSALGQAPRPGEQWALRALSPIEWLLPKRIRPIGAQQVALALCRAMDSAPAGVRLLDSVTLHQLGH